MSYEIKGSIIIDDDRNIIGANTFNGYVPVSPTINIKPGNGLSGGGGLNANVGIYALGGNGITVNSSGIHVGIGNGISSQTGSIFVDTNYVLTKNTYQTIESNKDISGNFTILSNSMVENMLILKDSYTSYDRGRIYSSSANSDLIIAKYGSGSLQSKLSITNTAIISTVPYSGNGSLLTSLNAQSINANTGLIANSTGMHVISGNSMTANSSGVHFTGNVNVYQATSIATGNGLTGGGTLASNRTLSVVAGNSIVSNATGVHFTGNVNTYQATTLTAGNGLGGGGDLSANRTFVVVANTGLIANTSGVHIDKNKVAVLDESQSYVATPYYDSGMVIVRSNVGSTAVVQFRNATTNNEIRSRIYSTANNWIYNEVYDATGTTVDARTRLNGSSFYSSVPFSGDGSLLTNLNAQSINANTGLIANSTGLHINNSYVMTTGTSQDVTGNKKFYGNVSFYANSLQYNTLSFRNSDTNLLQGVISFNQNNNNLLLRRYTSDGSSIEGQITISASSIIASVPYSGDGSLLTNLNAQSLIANTGITANSTGLHVLAGLGLNANSTSVNVVAGNSMVTNSTGVHFTGNVNAYQARSVSTGNGLTGGGTLAANRTLSVVANTGIIANATGLYVDTATILDTTSIQTITGQKIFSPQLTIRAANSTNAILEFDVTGTENRGSIYSASSDYSLYFTKYNKSTGSVSATLQLSDNTLKSSVPFEGSGAYLSANTVPATSLVLTPATSGFIANSLGLHINANTGLIANATGLHVPVGVGLGSNSTQVFAKANNGIIANTSGLYVKPASNSPIVVNANGVGLSTGVGLVVGANNVLYSPSEKQYLGVVNFESSNTMSTVSFPVADIGGYDVNMKGYIENIGGAGPTLFGQLYMTNGISGFWSEAFALSNPVPNGYIGSVYLKILEVCENGYITQMLLAWGSTPKITYSHVDNGNFENKCVVTGELLYPSKIRIWTNYPVIGTFIFTKG